ncbi:MAG: type IV pili methyl-accepting chemotaxis transducer N-terminal domain-containing protein [Roseibium sp.]|uniref:type IV pili methyl-accepting chemotaxis transducer N-terminal domain-containing protein n=1 Tax=Roseibium sp. TaxID=1936156 RepID=UPI001AFE0110|nr:type IV pili methyl-accepting chemotaxis transducer N-terminal domain-containing protein [Roseibium sp.]MBO6892396.1 type IV pili methyl-accepting chemotaxis transducer N-terminal domain-containing protein [Roseibium sp.]MBO6931861.1 type IV pili methyl-accepting chemotaxis transducer N-terminal domain-containing protein [Roseibium sp.]
MELSEDIYGKLINIAGRQRMLSQRIGFLLLSASSQSTGGPMSPALLPMLDRALEDFCTGHGLLLNGDEDAGLPKLAYQRIDAVLKTADTECGQHLIERFVHEARAFILNIEKGDLPEPKELAAFSDLVLVDLLQTLQAVVSALEEDFAEEMQRRRDRRNEETRRVMDAIQEIQKASKFSRMIALNAKISADRAGPFGKEFGALTEELKQISAAITDSSENILKHLERI